MINSGFFLFFLSIFKFFGLWEYKRNTDTRLRTKKNQHLKVFEIKNRGSPQLGNRLSSKIAFRSQTYLENIFL